MPSRAFVLFGLPNVVFVVITLLVAADGDTARVEFFRAGATVIPTLLLTLAVQARFFGPAREVQPAPALLGEGRSDSFFRRLDPWLVRLQAGLLILFFALGEVAALKVLADPADADAVATGAVWGSVVAGFVAIATVAFARSHRG